MSCVSWKHDTQQICSSYKPYGTEGTFDISLYRDYNILNLDGSNFILMPSKK